MDWRKVMRRLIIGTRGSKLALWQAEWVASELRRLNPDLQVELERIKTTGDKILDVPLAKIGGKGLFVKEIEEALLREEVDIAVHSMKDVPTVLPEGLGIVAVCRRESPRDVFVSRRGPEGPLYRGLMSLPEGARVGTSSLRRLCQVRHLRGDLDVVPLRGNLDTRLRKLDEGQFDAIIVAEAGMKRLGLTDRITQVLGAETLLPAIGQGAIGIEARVDREEVVSLIQELDHPETRVCVDAERSFLKRLEGGCQVPIAAYARMVNGKVEIEALVGDLEGRRLIRGKRVAVPERAEEEAVHLAEELLQRGAREILEEVYGRQG